MSTTIKLSCHNKFLLLLPNPKKLVQSRFQTGVSLAPNNSIETSYSWSHPRSTSTSTHKSKCRKKVSLLSGRQILSQDSWHIFCSSLLLSHAPHSPNSLMFKSNLRERWPPCRRLQGRASCSEPDRSSLSERLSWGLHSQLLRTFQQNNYRLEFFISKTLIWWPHLWSKEFLQVVWSMWRQQRLQETMGIYDY